MGLNALLSKKIETIFFATTWYTLFCTDLDVAEKIINWLNFTNLCCANRCTTTVVCKSAVLHSAVSNSAVSHSAVSHSAVSNSAIMIHYF